MKRFALQNLKIMLRMSDANESQLIRDHLEGAGHRVRTTSSVVEASELLRHWRPDVLITEQHAGDQQRSGIWLAEQAKHTSETLLGRTGCRVLLLISTSSWLDFLAARRTGAHVIARPITCEALLRYAQFMTDQIVSDRVLGPILLAIHRTPDGAFHSDCEGCIWVGSSLLYGNTELDLQFGGIQAATLNSLMFHRRGRSPEALANEVNENAFLQNLAHRRKLTTRAVKMEIARLRRRIELGLRDIGAPQRGADFLPNGEYGTSHYRLAGNWQLVHLVSTERD